MSSGDTMDDKTARGPAARGATAKAEGNLEGELRRFLAADAAEDDAAAERALGGLFAALEGPGPRADFAARVMARIEASPLRAMPRAARDLPPALRLPLAAALLLAGVAAFYGAPALYLLLARLDPAALIATGAGLGPALEARLAEWAWIAQVGRQLTEALFEVLSSPPVLLFVMLSAALATLLSRWLLILLEPARRPSDVAYR